ncbi:AraC family transcriptional regulator [Mycobacterium avium 11-0986]|nr:AraC family transcriptional regulator [Mycobacterium avium 11-0986]
MYRPSPPLAEHIEYFGYWRGDEALGVHTSRALPRGAVTAIIDVGGRTDLGFYASDARTPLTVPPAFAAGAGATAYVVRVAPAHTVMTIHFRPAGALAFLGSPLSDLEDALVGLEDLWGRDAALLREQLIDAVIDPHETRLLLRKSLKLLRDKQLWFRVARKHGLIPV